MIAFVPMNTHPLNPPSKIGRAITTGFLVLVLSTLAACTRTPPFSSHAAGHATTAWIKGAGAKLENRVDVAVLASEYGQVTIEPARVRIEGSAWVTIPEGAPVTVRIERGRISVKAGHVSVGQTVKF